MVDFVKAALLKDVKQSLEKAIDDVLEIANTHLKNEGDTCQESQLMCLTNHIMTVQNNVNGIIVDDLK